VLLKMCVCACGGAAESKLRPSSQHYAQAPGRCVATVTHVPLSVTRVPRNSRTSHNWSTCVLRRVGGCGVTQGCAGVCRYRLPWKFSRARPRGCRTRSSSRLRRLEASGWCFWLSLLLCFCLSWLLQLGPPVLMPSTALLLLLMPSTPLSDSSNDPPLFKSTVDVLVLSGQAMSPSSFQIYYVRVIVELAGDITRGKDG
jgi:hypothetical protein